MSAKPGTSLVIYAFVVPLILAGATAFNPLSTKSFSAAPLVIVISALFPPAGHGDVWYDKLYGGLVLPSPVLLIGHAFLCYGGWCFNRGYRDRAFGFLAYVSAALILYMIPICVMAAIWSLFAGGNRTAIILGVLLPAIYLGSLVAVLLATVRIGDNLQAGRQIPRWVFSRRLGIWGAAAALPIVLAVVIWRVTTVPQHRISITNETGRPIYLGTVRIGDFVNEFQDSYVLPSQISAPQSADTQRFTVDKEIVLADVNVKFRFNRGEPTHGFASKIYSSWYVDCSYEIAIKIDRIDISECQTDNLRDVID